MAKKEFSIISLFWKQSILAASFSIVHCVLRDVLSLQMISSNRIVIL